MSRQTTNTYVVTLLACCFVALLGVSVAGTGAVAAQEEVDVTVDVPEEATAGEQTTLSADVSVPDLPGSYENDATLTFYSDGQQIGSETVTISDGETTFVDLSHTFESAGDKEIRVEASTTFGGQEYSGSDTTTLSVVEAEQQISIDGGLSLNLETPDSPEVGEETTTTVRSDIPTITGAQSGELTLRLLVDGEETASKTITVSGDETSETDFTTVFDSSGETTVTVEAVLTVGDRSVSESVTRTVTVSEAPPETTAVEGAAFAVPESLEDEVAAYREAAPQEFDAHAFVLATEGELYVVFTQQEPTKGIASVEGPVLERELAAENLTYGVIAATSASFETTGTEVGVREVSENAEQYRLEVVRVTAQHRRVSTLTDPDEGEDFTLSTTAGVLVKNPRTAASLFQNVGNNARTLSRDISPGQIDAILDNPRGPHLHTFSFETKFWTDAETTVDAIVLDPQSAAQQFVSEYDQAGVAHAEDGEPVLYVVEENRHPQQMDDVASITSQSESLDGEVVETEVRLYQEKISVQETLEHNTGCNEDLLEIQTPEGPVCVNVAQDNLLHGGVAWNSIPQSRDDALLVMGVSSRHQDSPEKFEEGRYRIEGEVVSTARLNESLPDGSALIVYDMERVGDIDYEAVAEEARSLIETKADELTTRLRKQVAADGIKIETGRNTETVRSASPEKPATVTFSQRSRGPIAIQQARINVSSEVRNLRVDTSRVAALPSDVRQPPGQSLQVLNISTSAGDDAISDANFQIRVSSAAISEGSNITVSRYHGGEWTALDTSVVEETDTSIVLSVDTPGFSYFAVGTQSTDDQADEGDTSEGETDDSTSEGSEDDGTSGETGDESTSETGEETSASEETAEDADASGPGFTFLTIFVGSILFVGWKIKE